MWAVIGSFLLGTEVGITIGFYVAEKEWRKKPFPNEDRKMESGSGLANLPDSHFDQLLRKGKGEKEGLFGSDDQEGFWKVPSGKVPDGEGKGLAEGNLASDA